METQYWKVDPLQPDPAILETVAALIQAGEVIAFPSDTVYGLAADPKNESALTKIFVAKERPQEQPLLLLVGSLAQMAELVVEIPVTAQALIEHFWPGPLTLVLPGREDLSSRVKNGQGGVAVRMPQHLITQMLLQLTGPIVAPSANRHGGANGSSAEMVLHDLGGRIAAVLDGGRTGEVASTLVDCTGPFPQVLREGAISRKELGI